MIFIIIIIKADINYTRLLNIICDFGKRQLPLIQLSTFHSKPAKVSGLSFLTFIILIPLGVND